MGIKIYQNLGISKKYPPTFLESNASFSIFQFQLSRKSQDIKMASYTTDSKREKTLILFLLATNCTLLALNIANDADTIKTYFQKSYKETDSCDTVHFILCFPKILFCILIIYMSTIPMIWAICKSTTNNELIMGCGTFPYVFCLVSYKILAFLLDLGQSIGLGIFLKTC